MRRGGLPRVGVRRRVRGSGFTLIELLVVVVLIGLMAGLVGVSVGASGPEARRKRAMREVGALLGLVRAEAMEASGTRMAEIGVGEDGVLWARSGERSREWSEIGLSITGRGRTAEEARGGWERVEVEFDGLGRTRERVLVFESGEAGDRMWIVEFDPISGSVGVRGEESRARRGRTE